MSILSLSTGKPIAIIEGGELNQEIVYMRSLNKCVCKKHNDMCENSKKPCCRQCPYLPEERHIPANDVDILPLFHSYKRQNKLLMLQKLKYAVEHLIPPVEEDELEIYHKLLAMNKRLTSVKINQGNFQQLPNIQNNSDGTHERDVMLYYGSGGSGKSWQINKYLIEYNKIYKKNHIYVFSPHKTDAYSKIKNLINVVVDEELMNEKEIALDSLSNSVIVFDDVDSIQNKKVNEFIKKFRDFALENSRHHNINLLVTSHDVLTGRNNRLLLNELTHLYVFPRTNPNLNYLIKTYTGIQETEIKKIVRENPRWVCICKSYPRWVMTENQIYLI
jgi:hypothetical protein